MPDVATACVDALAAGETVEMAVAPWRRPGLARAIEAELAARGLPGAGWSFTDPGAPAVPDGDIGDVLGWVAGRPTSPLPSPRVVPAPVHPAPAVHRPVEVNTAAVFVPTQRRSTGVSVPAVPTGTGEQGEVGPSMMRAAYSVFATAQPVMADGLRPGPIGQDRATVVAAISRPSAVSALAELADFGF